MLEIKKIVVPVDFSDPSKKAFDYGVSLAVELEAELVVAHVAPSAPALEYAFSAESLQVPQQQMDEARVRIQAWLDSESREFVDGRVVIKAGNAKDGVLEVLTEEAPDLVVMGTHGHRRFERWMLGSVTEYVLRKTPAALLTVSHLDSGHELSRPRPVPMKKLLYATDLSPAAEHALEVALALARRFSAELIVLHVLRDLVWSYGMEYVPFDLRKEKAEMREAARRQLVSSVPEEALRDPGVRTELVEGVPADAILEVAEREGVDMIVLNTQSRSRIDRALLGATAERVVRAARVPVLSVPPPRAAS